MNCSADNEVCQRLISVERSITEINQRLSEGDSLLSEMQQFGKSFNSFIKEWPEVKENVNKTADIVAAWENLKGFNNTLSSISKFLKILTMIGGSIAGFYLMMKGLKI